MSVSPFEHTQNVMNDQPIATFGRIAAFILAGWLFSPVQAVVVPNDDYEILTRGPVHEAFAGTVTFDPEPGIIIDTTPPGAIEELPPEHQMEGENVAWIPGYWAWDEEQGSFLWVSGIWRNLPPGREWVPGYWNPVTGEQFQWISGYWADAQLTQVSYLPAPPRSIESGPSVAAVSSNHTWLPGTWVYQRNNYVWRSGYWAAPRENWVYVPATYVWTPRGHIFVDGYWDYAIPRRGVVFAPVHFHRPVYAVAGYRHTPRLVISLSVFTDHLFLRPSYRHYYFGDYYAPSYRTRGYYASYYYHNTRRGYDPVFAYNRWSHRHDRHWERNHRSRHERFRSRESARPARTWAAMQGRPDYHEDRAFATPIERYTRSRTATSGQRFRSVDEPGRERIAAQTRDVRNFRNERQRTEGRAGRAARATDRASSVERSRSPITSRDRVAGSENDRGRPDARTPGRSAPPAVGRPAREQQRAGREANRASRIPERAGRPAARPGSTAQRNVTRPERAQSQQRQQPTPQRAQRPQRQQPTPQRAQPQQRQQPTPQRAQRPQRQQPTPQRAQPQQRQQPTPQRVQRPQRQQPTPQRAQRPQRQQSTPQRAQRGSGGNRGSQERGNRRGR